MDRTISRPVAGARFARQMREKYGDHTVVLFRAGDFYKVYDDDATTVSRVTGLSVAIVDGVRCVQFPRHGLDVYLPMMVRRGHRIAITDERDDYQAQAKKNQ